MSEVRLILGDSVKMRGELPPFDALVTDPPYGIGYVHAGYGAAPKGRLHVARNANRPIAGDDKPFEPARWIDLGRPILFWGAQHCLSRLPAGGTLICWDKSCGIGPEDHFYDADFAWTSEATKRNVIRFLWKGVCCRKAGEDNGVRLHPTQKPLGLMDQCIRLMGLAPGATILDPYMGSGTTGVAAVRLGFNFVGVEIDPDHYATAQRRIQAELDRHPLFEPPTQARQSSMFAEVSA